MMSGTQSEQPSLAYLVFGGGTPKKAIGASLVVGTILVSINHGDAIWAGESPETHKIILTYCVPYLVTTWGAITGKLAAFEAK